MTLLVCARSPFIAAVFQNNFWEGGMTPKVTNEFTISPPADPPVITFIDCSMASWREEMRQKNNTISRFFFVYRGLSNDNVEVAKGTKISGCTAGRWFQNRCFRYINVGELHSRTTPRTRWKTWCASTVSNSENRRSIWLTRTHVGGSKKGGVTQWWQSSLLGVYQCKLSQLIRHAYLLLLSWADMAALCMPLVSTLMNGF